MDLNEEVIGQCKANIDAIKKEYNEGSERNDVRIKDGV